jgi:hypothetical protein
VVLPSAVAMPLHSLTSCLQYALTYC